MDAKVAQRNTEGLAEIIAFGFWNILHFQISESIFRFFFTAMDTKAILSSGY